MHKPIRTAAVAATTCFALVSLLGPAGAGAVTATRSTGSVSVVQAVPGTQVDVRVDGRAVRRQVGVGAVLGPFELAPGRHSLAFAGAPGGRTIETTVEVESGSGRDVVLHRPASVDGPLVVNTYATPDSAIGPGKARLLLAHTATVAPADVRFDGQVVFRNIANGEYADADVPAGQHRVALLPTGSDGEPLLGPLSVDLAPRTATMVYAVGNPRDRSMDVVTHTVALSADGSVAPREIDTGSVGLLTSVRGSAALVPGLSPWQQRSDERR